MSSYEKETRDAVYPETAGWETVDRMSTDVAPFRAALNSLNESLLYSKSHLRLTSSFGVIYFQVSSLKLAMWFDPWQRSLFMQRQG
jgi:hypothetical protein